jgi:ABC-type nitrate/sulfonate/bicarbonate transport system substrate-binding protein
MRAPALPTLAVSALLALTACGGGDDSTDAASGGGEGDVGELQVLIPAESPIEYPHRVAESLGFFEEEGLRTSYQYAGGSAEVLQQLVSGRGDIGVSCASAIVAGFEEGFTEIRPVFTTVYGSIFGLAVPGDSDVTSVEELEGATIGISDPAGGEVPIVKGLLRAAGLEESDVNLLPIGEGTAVALRAVQTGQVDAIGGSFSDFVGLQVQGLELETIGDESLDELPACAVVVTDEYMAENEETVEKFLRASAKGVLWGQENPDRVLEILREASPTGYEGQQGEDLVELYLPIMAPTDEERIGDVSPESYEAYFEFIGGTPPAGLADLIDDRFVDPANDFDRSEIADVD